MARFIGILVIVLLIIGVIGYYQGWLNVSHADQDGTTNVNVAIDKNKIKETEQKAQEQIKDASQKLKEKISGQSKQPPQ